MKLISGQRGCLWFILLELEDFPKKGGNLWKTALGLGLGALGTSAWWCVV
jgi:hypothetical protein